MRFQLIDKVIHFEPGKKGVGVKNITLTEDYFIEHYRIAPLMPESLIIETIAQMGGWTVAVSSDFRYVAIMLRIDKVKFYRYVRPGDQLVLTADIVYINEEGSLIEGRAEVGEEVVATVGRLLYANYPVPEQLKETIMRGFIYTSGGLLDKEGRLAGEIPIPSAGREPS